MEKHYVAGRIEEVEALELMENVGLTDAIDQTRLIAALDAIREYGAPLPSEPRGNGDTPKSDDKATDAQLALIAKLEAEKKVAGPDLPITKAQAHEIIDALKSGSYDADKYSVPF
jgi:hypothetical protein